MYWTTMAPRFAAPVLATLLDGLMRGHTNVTLDLPFGGVLTASGFMAIESQDGRASSNSDAGTAVNCGDARVSPTALLQISRSIYLHWRTSPQ
jgi:hypothetical protein